MLTAKLILLALLLGPIGDLQLVFSWKNGSYSFFGPIESDDCFTQAAEINNYNYTMNGPFRRLELGAAFCIDDK